MRFLRMDRDGAVLTVRLDNPPFNFLTRAMLVELEQILDTVDRDRTIRAVVLASAVPDVFISHYDVEEILAEAERAGISAPPRLVSLALRTVTPLHRVRAVRRLMDRSPLAGFTSILRYHDITRRMRASGAVFVAAVNGRALGGGCELTLGCDIRVMADGPYEIGQPEILLGLLPGGGGTQMLTRTLGAARTIELALEGRLFTPAQALEAGIVQHLAPPDAVVEQAQAIAARLARRSPAAVKAIKQAVYDGGSRRLETGMAMERARFLALASRTDTKAAMHTYLKQVRDFRDSGREIGDFVDERFPAWQDGTAADF